MNISEIFIRRPVMTSLLMLGILLFGILGYRALPISDLPNVDFPTIVVTATLPGASPETIATAVATPLENNFSSIAGIDSMTSTSSLGQAKITLQFSLERDIDSAAQDVQAAISQATRDLPRDMPSPPSYRKVNPAAAPILYIALSSPTLPLYEVDRYAQTFLAKRISMISGVAEVNVFGSQKYAVRILVNPDTLAAYKIGIDEVIAAIRQSNVNLPTGTLESPTQSYLIKTSGQLKNAKAYSSLIVTERNGAPISLGTLATIVDSVENNKAASWLNGTRAIILAVQRQPGTNTIAVVNNIKNMLSNFESQLPHSVKLNILYDRSESIRASFNEVKYTLIIAAILVVLVIFLFLRNFSATLLPAAALPLSIIATFAVMYQLHFTLDNLSLLGLTLVVGFVVDDAIVMLENIYRHNEKGKNPFESALDGSKEISFTIISMTLSLVAVFIPVLFMGGIMGRLLHEFAITICTAILLSGFVSLTLTPMLASKMTTLSNQTTSLPYMVRYFGDVLFPKLTQYYRKSLEWILQHKRFTLGLFWTTLVFAALLFYIVPKGFLPSEDTGQIFGYTEADPSVSFATMVKRQQAVADIILQDPNIKSVMSSVGSGGVTSTTNAGRVFVKLKPLHQRALRADQIIQELRRKISVIAGIKVYLQNRSSIHLGALSKSTYQYTLQDGDTAELNHWANIFQDEIHKLPSIQDVTTNLQYTGPQIHIDIDRNKASTLGVTTEQIQQTLASAYGTQQISTIYTDVENYKVILEVEPDAQHNINSLSRLYIHSSSGKHIPLATIAKFEFGTGPLTINHQGQLSSITISFNLKPGNSLGDVVSQIERIKNKLSPPATLIAGFQGTAQAFQSSLQGFGLLVIMAILVIYIMLGILYESFIHPLTILSGLPAAGVGALITLLLFGLDLNFYSFIGIIMLIGIVKKNAIMMIDFALDAQRKQNKSPEEAIFQACLTRFRPIMMTTLAAMMAALPIALAFGAGAENRRPLGLAVLGGLVVSQLLTLYITPVIYLYFEGLKKSHHSTSPA